MQVSYALCAKIRMNFEAVGRNHYLYRRALDLRYELFFKVHDLPFDILIDEIENESEHVVAFNESHLLAYGRLHKQEEGKFQISQMVVSPNNQGQGVGSKILVNIMQRAKDQGANVIILNARTTAIWFYKRHGFKSSGSIYSSETTGVAHVKMVYEANT